MSPTTSAGISDVGVVAGSPAASMSMADSKASPSIGPCSRIALPLSRSCSRSDGVAVTPLFVASAVWVRIAASGWRQVGVAQVLGQALAVAARVGIYPLDGLPEGGMPAGFAGAFRQTRFGRSGRFMCGQRQVVPLQGHVGIAGHPTFEHREIGPAERAFEVRVQRQCETTFRIAHLPRRPCHLCLADWRRSLRCGPAWRTGHEPDQQQRNQHCSQRPRPAGPPAPTAERLHLHRDGRMFVFHGVLRLTTVPRRATRCRVPGRSSRPP